MSHQIALKPNTEEGSILGISSREFNEAHVAVLNALKVVDPNASILVRLALQSDVDSNGDILPSILNDSAATMLNLLLGCRSLWRHIELIWDHPEMPLDANSCATPILETFILKAPNVELEKVKDQVNHLLNNAPNLRNLEVSNQHPWSGDVNTQLFFPSFANLRNLKLDYEISSTECIDILRQCQMLETAVFYRVGRQAATGLSGHRAAHQLSHLHLLDISSISHVLH